MSQVSIYREDFVSYLETVRFESKSWVLRHNWETLQICKYDANSRKKKYTDFKITRGREAPAL